MIDTVYSKETLFGHHKAATLRNVEFLLIRANIYSGVLGGKRV